MLTGARQTGKSTLARMLGDSAGRQYLSLDDPETLALARNDPDHLLASAETLTLDEVQRVPGLMLAVKRAVDRDRRKGRFLLTGSANLLLMRQVSESLAGRAVYLTLGPMTAGEVAGDPGPGPWDALLAAGDLAAAARVLEGAPRRRGPWRETVARGGFPPAALEPDAAVRARWFDGYVRTYLERDLQQLARIDALPEFRRLLRSAAQRTGALCNFADLARDAGLPGPTARRYLGWLEVSYLLHRLPPYAVNRRKRLVRTPKLYLGDTGLAAHLAEWRPDGDPAERLTGALLENRLLGHLLAWRETRAPRPEVLHWRTAAGQEVDFVVEAGDRLLPVEVKATASPGVGATVGLVAFLAEYPRQAPFGLLVCDIDAPRPVGRNVLAVPLGCVC